MRLTGKNKDGRYGFITESNTLGIFDENSLADKCYTKLGQLEDIEERLSKYKDIGIGGLVDLFKNLTDEDIEYVVQLAFKKRKIIYDIR